MDKNNEIVSAEQAQAVIETDRTARIQRTLNGLKKLLEENQTDIVPILILRGGQHPEAQIQVVAK